MSTAIAVAAAANGVAAVAAQQAREARRDACKIMLNSYDPKTATVEQAQTYAQCVNLLFPTDPDGTGVIGLKIVVAVVMFCVVAGGVIGGAVGDWEIRDIVFGVLVALVIAIALCLFGAGIWFLFS